ncbi:MAG: DUF814 domain-containing protein, partial [Deltaproteobacteria bacterium]|nr:DUF814 domain-containing protein [Candidatus Tharpella sp.]
NKYQRPETVKLTAEKKASFLLAGIIGQDQIADLAEEELQSRYDDWFFPRYRSNYGSREIKRLEKALRQHRRRLQKRVKRLNEEMGEKKSHLNDSHLGDLLKGALHQVKKGAKSIQLTNYWSPDLEEVEIKLNPALSPLANLEKFYKNAKKAKRGLKLIEKRLIATRREEDYAEELLFQFEELKSNPEYRITDEEQDLLELASDLAERKGRQHPPEKSHKRKKNESKPDNSRHRGVERKNGVEGGIIYVGRNALGNENIYRRLSSPDDLWFHTLNRPGAHILLKTAPGSKSSEKEQFQAATLAAANSRGKNEKQVEVTMIQVKHLRKPKGGRPGQVLLSGPRQTLTVNPNDSFQENRKS